MMTAKSVAAWRETKQWCERNPGKKAAIVTPDGTFEMVYTKQADLDQLRGRGREAEPAWLIHEEIERIVGDRQ